MKTANAMVQMRTYCEVKPMVNPPKKDEEVVYEAKIVGGQNQEEENRKKRQAELDEKLAKYEKLELSIREKLKSIQTAKKAIHTEQKALWEENNKTFFDIWQEQLPEKAEEN